MRASLWRRLGALLYDSLLLLAIAWTVTAIYVAAEVLLLGSDRFGNDYHHMTRPPLQFLLLSVSVGFYSYFWHYHGRTLGMQSWRLKIVSIHGGPPSLLQCLCRCIAAIGSAACGGCGYWWTLLDRDGRSWHDRLSGTNIVLLAKSRGSEKDDPL